MTKRFIVLSGIALIGLASLACTTPLTSESGERLIGASGVVTRANLHPDEKRARLSAVNYQLPGLIPMCTPVRLLSQSRKALEFEVIETRRRYTYYYHKAAGEPFNVHLQRYFGKDCDSAKVQAMSPLDRAGIDDGKVYIGMSKNAVRYALGTPPRHKTPDLNAPVWRYWRSRFKSFAVQFDGSGKVKGVRGLKAAQVQPPKDLIAGKPPAKKVVAKAPAPKPPPPAITRPAVAPERKSPRPMPPGGPLYSSRIAVVVGINEYDEWPALTGATNDARRMASFLRANGFDEVIEVYDEQATRRNLLRALGTKLPRATDENSLAFIYFAGHGQTETLPTGGKRGYIVPVDGSVEDVFSTGISMEKLRDLSARTPAKHVYYAFDSCYSGLALTRGISVRRVDDPNEYLRKMTRVPSVQIITAGSEGEKAVEVGGQGLFTSYLLRAMGGEADADGDGAVTASEIGTFVKPSVSRASRNRQTPQFGTIDGGGEIVFEVR
ncbi:MAG: caspase family protein [Myxococcota bacterium]